MLGKKLLFNPISLELFTPFDIQLIKYPVLVFIF